MVSSDLSRSLRIISHTLVRETGIEAGGRLVEKQNSRRVHQSAGDFQPPAHAAGKCAHQRIAKLQQIHGFQQLVDQRVARWLAGTP